MATLSLASMLFVMSCHRGHREIADGIETVHGRYTPATDHLLHRGDYWSNGEAYKDSIDVHHGSYACDCQQWVSAAYVEEQPINYALLNANSYYIEPSGSPSFLDSTHNIGMRLMLYGHLDTSKRYPKSSLFIDSDTPVRGHVFIYSAYRVIDPGHLDGGDTAYDIEYDTIIR